MILVYFGVFARKSSLQLEWLQAPLQNYWSPLPCAFPIVTHLKYQCHTHLPQAMVFQSYTTVPKPSKASSHPQDSPNL